MPHTEWRSPAAYEDLRALDAPGFAWEFLSRNPAFERDCKRLEYADDQDPHSAGELEDFARRWGVRFRNARLQSRRMPSSVDAGELAERDPHRPPPARSRRPEPAG